jgi:hypothetical protein
MLLKRTLNFLLRLSFPEITTYFKDLHFRRRSGFFASVGTVSEAPHALFRKIINKHLQTFANLFAKSCRMTEAILDTCIARPINHHCSLSNFLPNNSKQTYVKQLSLAKLTESMIKFVTIIKKIRVNQIIIFSL